MRLRSVVVGLSPASSNLLGGVIFSFQNRGSFSKTEAFLKRASKPGYILNVLKANGQAGVEALSSATPVDSRLAAESWGFEVETGPGSYSIIWTNNDIENGFPVIIRLQYGYGTGTGGYVAGRDFINPAIKPIFDMISDKVWKAVNNG